MCHQKYRISVYRPIRFWLYKFVGVGVCESISSMAVMARREWMRNKQSRTRRRMEKKEERFAVNNLNMLGSPNVIYYLLEPFRWMFFSLQIWMDLVLYVCLWVFQNPCRPYAFLKLKRYLVSNNNLFWVWIVILFALFSVVLPRFGSLSGLLHAPKKGLHTHTTHSLWHHLHWQPLVCIFICLPVYVGKLLYTRLPCFVNNAENTSKWRILTHTTCIRHAIQAMEI